MKKIRNVTQKITMWPVSIITTALCLLLSMSCIKKTEPAAPVITSELTASGMVGSPFSYTITASGSLIGFNAIPLPAGLYINNATGVISGKPTTVGTANVTISATNVPGVTTGSGTATLVITIAPPVPIITSALTKAGAAGSPFSYTITASGTPTSFSATPLPAGLTINTTTGIISGTPTTQGSANVTISASNVSGTGTATLAITIAAALPLPVITSALTKSGNVSLAFSYTIAASGTPTSFSATPLPAGLAVDATTGVISGTPTAAGTTNVTIGATNTTGTGTATLAITIGAAPITMGVTTILSEVDYGNGDYLINCAATLSQTATLQSLSIYIIHADGNLRMAVYDATGPGGGPGALKAQTNSFTPVTGWNTANVITPVSLTAGTYWLAHLPSSSALTNGCSSSGGSSGYTAYTFGPMPATFPAYTSMSYRYSSYATLIVP